jgi:hypothetical protein
MKRMLCEACKSIFDEFVASYGFKSYLSSKQHISKTHHQTIEELHEAAAAHCQICVQLFLNLQQHYWGSFAPDSPLSAPEKILSEFTEETQLGSRTCQTLATRLSIKE